MVPQRDRGPSKYFDKVTDLFDIDDEQNQRHQSTIISNPSDDEGSGEYSKASRNQSNLFNRQVSTILDWNGAKNKNNQQQGNKNNYIIEQWDEESDNIDDLIGRKNPADAIGIEVFANGLEKPLINNIDTASSVSLTDVIKQ